MLQSRILEVINNYGTDTLQGIETKINKNKKVRYKTQEIERSLEELRQAGLLDYSYPDFSMTEVGRRKKNLIKN